MQLNNPLLCRTHMIQIISGSNTIHKQKHPMQKHEQPWQVFNMKIKPNKHPQSRKFMLVTEPHSRCIAKKAELRPLIL